MCVHVCACVLYVCMCVCVFCVYSVYVCVLCVCQSQIEKLGENFLGAENEMKINKYKVKIQRNNITDDRRNVCMYVCMYVWSSHIAEYGSTG